MKKLLTADYLLPISTPPIRDGAVLVDSGRISSVGTSSDLTTYYPDVPLESYSGCALLPGFVNCHSHLELTALRGLLDDLDHDFAAWLVKLTKIRAEILDDRDILDSALAGAVEGLKSGVTCFGDIGRWGKAGFNALEKTGLRGVLFQETEFSPEDPSAEDDHRALLEKVLSLRKNRGSGRVDVGISPHSPYTVSRSLFGLIAETASELDLKVTIHAAESESEQQLLTGRGGFFAEIFDQYEIKWTAPGMQAVEYLADTGILQTKPLLAHCTKADESEIALISESGSRVAHCPKSNAKFGHGIAPLSGFLASGIRVGLGTDSMVSNNICDLIEEARFAALAARARDGAADFIQPSQALRLATLGGAEALALDKVTGSIEEGKSADLTAVSLRDVSRLPVNDVESAIVFASRASDVVMTMVKGDVLYKDGLCLKADEERVGARMMEIGKKLSNAV